MAPFRSVRPVSAGAKRRFPAVLLLATLIFIFAIFVPSASYAVARWMPIPADPGWPEEDNAIQTGDGSAPVIESADADVSGDSPPADARSATAVPVQHHCGTTSLLRTLAALAAQWFLLR